MNFAARELARRGVRRLFVVDKGKLVGVVSRRDLLGVFRRSDEDIQHEIQQEILVPKILGVIEVRNRLDYTWNDMPQRQRT